MRTNKSFPLDEGNVSKKNVEIDIFYERIDFEAHGAHSEQSTELEFKG